MTHNKYNNGKIYTIRYKHDETLIYIGSTTHPLHKRFHQHKLFSKKQKHENIFFYQTMAETDINDWYIELYEDYSCERREQLLKREGEVIRDIGSLNKNIAGTTINENYKKEYNKEYYKENQDILIQKCKEYRDNNKDIIAIQRQKYRIVNKDIINQKSHLHYEANKDIINEQKKEKISCVCGCIIRKSDIARHNKSNKHQNFINNK
jgi:hypothetical protein